MLSGRIRTIEKQAGIANSTARYNWVDYAKGIAIFLVVYRHAFEGLKRAGLNVEEFMGLEYANILFFSFRMPLFFIVSGIFLGSSLAKRGIASFTKQKARTILYPYFLWGGFQILTQLLLSGVVNSNRSFIDFTLLLYDPKGVDQFWYLYALFNVTVLYAFLKSVLKLQSVSLFVIGAILYLFSSWSVQSGWNLYFINDLCHYFIYIVIGDFVAAYFKDPKNFHALSSFRLGLIVLPFFVLTQSYFMIVNLKYDPNAYHYVENYQPVVFLLIALVGCLLMINISFILQRLNIARWVRMIGFHSLYIYVSHVFITSFSRIVLVKMGITYVPLLLIICILVGVYLPIALYKLCQRKGWYFVFTLDKKSFSFKPYI